MENWQPPTEVNDSVGGFCLSRDDIHRIKNISGIFLYNVYMEDNLISQSIYLKPTGSPFSKWKLFLVIGLAITIVALVSWHFFSRNGKGLMTRSLETSSWKTFSSATEGFTFKYPNDWTIENNSNTNCGFTVLNGSECRDRYDFVSPDGIRVRYVVHQDKNTDRIGCGKQSVCWSDNVLDLEELNLKNLGHVYLVKLDKQVALHIPLSTETTPKVGENKHSDFGIDFSLPSKTGGRYDLFITTSSAGYEPPQLQNITSADFYNLKSVRQGILILKSLNFEQASGVLNTRTYKNEKYGFELKYPENWIECDFSEGDDSPLVVIVKKCSDSKSPPEGIRIESEPVIAKNYTNLSQLQEALTQTTKKTPNRDFTIDGVTLFDIGEVKEILLNGGVSALQVEQISPAGYNGSTGIFVFNGSNLLRITHWNVNGVASFKNEMDQIISTFKLTALISRAILNSDPLLEKFGFYPSDTFKNYPDILNGLKKIDSKFTDQDMNVSSGNKVVILEDGTKMLLLQGCFPHSCENSYKMALYDPNTKEIYLQTPNGFSGKSGSLTEKFLIDFYGKVN